MKRALLVVLLSIAPSPKNPLLGAEPVDESFTATVVTHLPAGSYTYLELERSRGERTWVVAMGEAPRSGLVTVRAYARARDFESRRLHRTFDTLLFGAVHPQFKEQ